MKIHSDRALGQRNTYGWDGNGNRGTRKFATRLSQTFDSDNRLIGVIVAGSISTYTFDGDGLRRTAHGGGGTLTTMIWDGTDYLGEV